MVLMHYNKIEKDWLKNMSTSILYFSRTKETKKMAEKLAGEIGATAYEITDNKNWDGGLGLIKGLFYAAANKKVEVSYDKAADEAETLIVMSPLWLAGPSVAVKNYLDAKTHSNVHFVLANHSSPIDKPLAKFASKYDGIKKFYGITHKLENSEEVLAQVKADLA